MREMNDEEKQQANDSFWNRQWKEQRRIARAFAGISALLLICLVGVGHIMECRIDSLQKQLNPDGIKYGKVYLGYDIEIAKMKWAEVVWQGQHHNINTADGQEAEKIFNNLDEDLKYFAYEKYQKEHNEQSTRKQARPNFE